MNTVMPGDFTTIPPRMTLMTKGQFTIVDGSNKNPRCGIWTAFTEADFSLVVQLYLNFPCNEFPPFISPIFQAASELFF